MKENFFNNIFIICRGLLRLRQSNNNDFDVNNNTQWWNEKEMIFNNWGKLNVECKKMPFNCVVDSRWFLWTFPLLRLRSFPLNLRDWDYYCREIWNITQFCLELKFNTLSLLGLWWEKTERRTHKACVTKSSLSHIKVNRNQTLVLHQRNDEGKHKIKLLELIPEYKI